MKNSTITIDDKTYPFEELPDAVKNLMFHLQTVDAEINRLNMQLAIHQTAKQGYSQNLKNEMSKWVESQPKNEKK